MTIAAKEVNQALGDREFAKSTSFIYQYWYNHLCDVYIENSKAILQDGTPEEKLSAQETLYSALESALTLIHPYMPFLTGKYLKPSFSQSEWLTSRGTSNFLIQFTNLSQRSYGSVSHAVRTTRLLLSL